MKKFSDLKVGDMLYVYYFYNKHLATREIISTLKCEKIFMIECKHNEISNLLFNIAVDSIEKDFYIIVNNYQGYGRKLAISTSMDKLLLEVSE